MVAVLSFEPCVNSIVGLVNAAPIFTVAVAVIAGQLPTAAKVYVTVYVPAVLVEGVISPVLELIVKPAVEEKVPPVVPVMVGS